VVKTARLWLAACVALCATLLVSGCASGAATITGTLDAGNGACFYVRGQDANGTDVYWLRQLPSDYETDEHGLIKPDGSHIGIGDSLTVSGTLSFVLWNGQCTNGPMSALDATAIE